MILFEDDLPRPLPMPRFKALPSQGKFYMKKLSSLKCHSLILGPILGKSAIVTKVSVFRSGPGCSKLGLALGLWGDLHKKQ